MEKFKLASLLSGFRFGGTKSLKVENTLTNWLKREIP